MKVPSEKALDEITKCFCKKYRGNRPLNGCFDCPLHSIRKGYHAICADYCSDSEDDRIALLAACIKHGNAEIFSDLAPEYMVFIRRTKATII